MNFFCRIVKFIYWIFAIRRAVRPCEHMLCIYSCAYSVTSNWSMLMWIFSSVIQKGRASECGRKVRHWQFCFLLHLVPALCSTQTQPYCQGQEFFTIFLLPCSRIHIPTGRERMSGRGKALKKRRVPGELGNLTQGRKGACQILRPFPMPYKESCCWLWASGLLFQFTLLKNV